MAVTYKVLGQSSPSATTDTTLYTVTNPVLSAVCSTLVICNRGASTTVRVTVRPAGVALLDKHYLLYDHVVSQNDTVTLTIGMTLQQTDIVTVYNTAATCSFTLFGQENS